MFYLKNRYKKPHILIILQQYPTLVINTNY